MTGMELWATIVIGGITFLSFSARALYQLVLMVKGSKNGNTSNSRVYAADLARHHVEMADRFKELKVNSDKHAQIMEKSHTILNNLKSFLERNEKDHEKQMDKHDKQIAILQEICIRIKDNGRL